MFNTGHALLLVGTRILHPPIYLRLSGGNAGESPTAIRRDTRRITDNYAAVYAPVHPVKSPGNFRATARHFSGTFPPQWRRAASVIVGTFAGHIPVIFPAYARH
jgi:hypothetical protein